MKQRPGVVIFVGTNAKMAAEHYQAQLDVRAALVRCVLLDGDEGASSIRQAMGSALDLFTAECLERLVKKGLLFDAALRDVPVLIVAHQSDTSRVKEVASALIEAAADFPNLNVKLRFTTLIVSDAALVAARELGKALTTSFDSLITSDGVAFRNTVLLVCKERRGAPVSEVTMAPIMARLALILTTFDYDRDWSAFSAFWNSRIGGGGQVYFVGLIAYKAERVQPYVNKLLYREASSRLLEVLSANTSSILLDLGSEVLTGWVLNALNGADSGVGLVKGSEDWIKLTARYRRHVIPSLLRHLLPNVKSLSELQCALEAIRERVRPQTDRPNESAMEASLGIALLGLDVAGWRLSLLIALAAVSLGVIAWKLWEARSKPAVLLPSSPILPQIPRSPVFVTVLDELLEQLGDHHSGEKGPCQNVGEDHENGGPSQTLPLCEVIYDLDKSGAGTTAARNAASDAGADLIRLLVLTKLRGEKWLSAEMAADLTDILRRARHEIEKAALSDFVLSAEQLEGERGHSASVQDILFAPAMQSDQSHRFAFFGPDLKKDNNRFEICAVRSTINFLYLVE